MIRLTDFTDHTAGNLLVRPMSDTVYNMVLSASSEDHITIPAGATRVILSANADAWVKVGPSSVSATIPGSDVVDGTGSVLNPTGFSLKATDVRISVISPSICKISLEFYA